MKCHSYIYVRNGLLCLLIAAIFSSCAKTPEQQAQDARKGELTRELATTLLNEYLAKPHADIMMTKSGFALAAQDGLLVNQSGFGGTSYGFTNEWNTQVAPVIDAARQHWVDIKSNGDMVLCLREPLAESVTKITGITEGTEPVVEFETAYVFPANVQFLARYCYSGRNTKALFQKYDDGWRVSSNMEIPLPDWGSAYVPGM